MASSIPDIAKEESLETELRHFLECIEKDKTPIAAGESARDALKTALTIQDIIWNTSLQKS